MMGGLRAFAQSFAGKAVLVFLAFMLLGSGVIGSISLFTSSRVSTGINADGQNINELEIATQARNTFYELGTTFERFGQQLDSEEAFARIGLTDQVRETTQARLVNEIAFKAQAANLGIGASQADLSAHVQNLFQDAVTGTFSERTMSRTLAANGLTERAYLRDLSGELASNRLFNAADDIVFDGESDSAIAEVPETLAQAQFSAAWSRYDVSYFAIDPSQVDLPTPTDEELKSILESDPENYQRPEYREFVGIFLTPEDLIDSIEVEEEDIQATYDQYVARLEVSTRWFLRQLFVDDEATANAIVDAVRGGQTFVEAAAANGASAPQDLGPRGSSYGRDAVNTAFIAATESGMLDPIADNNRFTLIEVYEIDIPEAATLEEYRETAVREIAEPQASTILSARFSDLDGLIGSLSLEEAAAQVDLPVVTGTVAKSGLDARLEGLPANSKISSEIFTAPVGQTGFRNTFGDEGLFIVRVDAVEESRPMTFDEAKSSLTIGFNTATRADLLTGLGQAALSQINDSAGFAEFAASSGLEINEEDGKTASELLRASLPVEEIRGAVKDDIVSGVTNTGFNIIWVRDSRAADPELDAEALEGIRYQLARQYDDAMQRAYRTAVRETVNVNVNNVVFERAISSGLNAYLDLRSGGSGQIRLPNSDPGYGGNGSGGGI